MGCAGLTCMFLFLGEGGGGQPAPRTGADVWLQIGHIYELQKDYDKAMEAYQVAARRDEYLWKTVMR